VKCRQTRRIDNGPQVPRKGVNDEGKIGKAKGTWPLVTVKRPTRRKEANGHSPRKGKRGGLKGQPTDEDNTGPVGESGKKEKA